MARVVMQHRLLGDRARPSLACIWAGVSRQVGAMAVQAFQQQIVDGSVVVKSVLLQRLKPVCVNCE